MPAAPVTSDVQRMALKAWGLKIKIICFSPHVSVGPQFQENLSQVPRWWMELQVQETEVARLWQLLPHRGAGPLQRSPCLSWPVPPYTIESSGQ